MQPARLLVVGILLAVLGGCGYTTRPMYPTHIRTVYVPMFDSALYRRGLEFQLTEAVIKEIEQKTPYKVVQEPNADTRLSGRIVSLEKRVLSETPGDDPREIGVHYAVKVTWEDLRLGTVLSQQTVPLDSGIVRVSETSSFVPEVGQSFSTATAKATAKLAERIVAMMEEPW